MHDDIKRGKPFSSNPVGMTKPTRERTNRYRVK
jgi:hypothetical protein